MRLIIKYDFLGKENIISVFYISQDSVGPTWFFKTLIFENVQNNLNPQNFEYHFGFENILEES